jgi:hypothetical protein
MVSGKAAVNRLHRTPAILNANESRSELPRVVS